ncbi:hypothetical protein CA267_006620 [Alteromonas pelagimontana]|uniref:Uncharacterized protein n=1 Tax=Alteromonas pelagimontana TaxID=1858656 RepID=A0A6M4MBS0_9ALTE|nr:hypothetical protein [Alteromonas pelagimontana]QJR80469.1 hypothetical protein CA267_006620 [Alteromonas pelagimontana]
MINQDNEPKHNSIANMKGLESAIANGEETRVKQLLTNLVLDELQKSYLIDIADLNGNQNIVKLLQDTPVKP